MTEFEKIIKDGRLLYEYTRGSTLYNLNTPDSDVDTSAVFIANPSEYLGFLGYKAQVSDAKHDNTWFEVGNFIELLMKSNPTVLEALFIPENKIIGDVHPYMNEILENRDKFVTKQCFNPFFGYAKSQIEKARGLNKKIVNPVLEKLGPLDFTYTTYKQGSTKIVNWLERRGLKQRYCGLVNIPNMHDVYGLYYDFGNHIAHEEGWEHNNNLLSFVCTLIDPTRKIEEIFLEDSYNTARSWLREQPMIGYRGIVSDNVDSHDLRLSSIDNKDDRPICHIAYNQTGYTKHCIDYKQYKEWERMRNPKRYESNLDKNYDSKNMMHCFRMIHMAKEIAEGKGIILERDWDHDFLMKIRNHEFEYDELIEMLNQEKDEMELLMKQSTISDHIDPEFANKLLLNIRYKQLKGIRK